MKWKKIIAVSMAVVTFCTSFTIPADAAETATEAVSEETTNTEVTEEAAAVAEEVTNTENTEVTYVAEGTCGENLTWTLDSNGKLEISGTGAMTNYSSSSKAPWYSSRSSITSLVLSENITSIGNYAFFGCSKLVGNLVIPDSVTGIGEYAFSKCSGFEGDLVIPGSVTSVGTYAFSSCSGFSGDLVIPGSVTSIESNTFKQCGFKGNLVISDGVTSIGASAFEGCSGFKGDLKIPNGVTSIGASAFKGCSGFTGNLVIPGSVTSIGANAFNTCSSFDGNLVISDGVTSIGTYAFYACKGFTGNLVIPNSVTSIGTYAFAGCSSFKGDLVIPGSVTSISASAFGGCSGFAGDLIIPDSVTSIDSSAFYNCSGFTGKLVLSSGLTEMGSNALKGMDGLTSVTFRSTDVPKQSGNAYTLSGVTTVTVPEESYGAYVEAYTSMFPNAEFRKSGYLVKFDTQGGSAITDIVVKENTAIGEKCPADPEKPQHQFLGWFQDAEASITWDMESDLVNTDGLTLYAGWKAIVAEISVEGQNAADGSPIEGMQMSPSADGTNRFFEAETVSVTALPSDENYTFIGWYAKDDLSKALTNYLTYSFEVTQAMTAAEVYGLVAVYEPVKKAVTVSATSYKLNNTEQTEETVTEFSLGTEVTVEYTGDNFAYWTDTKGIILSKNPVYTFKAVTDITLIPVVKDVLDTKILIFESAYAQVIKRAELTEAELGNEEIFSAWFTANVPDVPSRTGWGEGSWKMTASDIYKALVTDGEASITVTPEYEPLVEKATVKVVGGTIHGTEKLTTAEYELNTIVKLTADEAKSGQKFAYWKDESGTILGYNDSYTFYLAKNVTITAVFVEDESTVEKLGTTEVVAITVDAATKKLTFVTMHTVPEGCKIVYAGVVATPDTSTANNLNASTARIVRGGSTSALAYRYTWSIKNPGSGPVFVRSYLVYKDANGKTCTIYGDLVQAQLP